MMAKWEKLSETKRAALHRGGLLKFPASYPFEDQVVMMLCQPPFVERRLTGALALMTITGYKAGINAYVVFPTVAQEGTGISVSWLRKHWKLWVWPDGDVKEVWVSDPLEAADL